MENVIFAVICDKKFFGKYSNRNFCVSKDLEIKWFDINENEWKKYDFGRVQFLYDDAATFRKMMKVIGKLATHSSKAKSVSYTCVGNRNDFHMTVMDTYLA